MCKIGLENTKTKFNIMNGKEFLEDYDPQIKEVGYENYSYTPEQVIKRLDDFAKSNLHGVSRSNAMDTKKGLKLALDYISKTPCDPDITSEQLDAWLKLQDFVNKHLEK